MRFVEQVFDWGNQWAMAVQRGPWRHAVRAKATPAPGGARIPFKVKVEARQRLRAWAVRTRTAPAWRLRAVRSRRRCEDR